MTKGRLRIIRKENRCIIRKRVEIVSCIVFAIMAVFGLCFPAVFDELKNITAFCIFYAIWLLICFSILISVHLGKIVIDSDKREISIHNFCRETYRFDQVRELKAFFKDGGPEGRDEHKVLLIFHGGHQADFETAGREQTAALIALLRPIIFADESEGT